MFKSLLCGAALASVVASAAIAQTPPVTAPGADRTPAADRAATTPPAATKAEPMKVNALVGRDVRNVTNEAIGEVNNVVVDPDGKIQQVIVSVGGVLGVGAKHVALAWNQVRVDSAGSALMVDLTKDQLKSAPEVEVRKGEPAAPARTMPAPAPTTRPQ